MTDRRLLPTSLLTLIGVLVFTALPAIAAVSESVPDAAEAWYDTSPSTFCWSPIGCPPVPLPANEYPANTLHIGVTGGREMARSYVMPDLSRLSGTVLPSAGMMRLPLATAPGNGNSNDSAAVIEACLANAPFEDQAQGSTKTAPGTNCQVHASLKYESTFLTLDLTPFLAAWRAGSPEYGIALVPGPASGSLTSDWHVALNGLNLANAPHITSTFPTAAFTSEPQNESPPASSGTETQAGSEPGSTVSPGGSPTISSPTALGLRAVNAAPNGPSVANLPGASPTSSQAVTSEPRATVASAGGFQYPEVLLLPLILVGGALYVARILTTDATPRFSRTSQGSSR